MKRIAATVFFLAGCAHAPVENTTSQADAAPTDVRDVAHESGMQTDWATRAQITAPTTHSAHLTTAPIADQAEMLAMLRDVEMDLDGEPVRTRLAPLPAFAL